MGGLSLWHWLIFLAIFVVPLAVYLWLRRRPPIPGYRPLGMLSPLLSFFVVVGLIGKPVLEYLKKNQALSDALSPLLLLPLILFLLVCVYVAVGVGAYFFYRAMQNINFFANARVLVPSLAWLTITPLANMVAMPYVWGRTYYFSRALHPSYRIAKLTAALVAVGAFGLIMLGLTTGIMSENNAIWPAGYDGESLAFLSLCVGSSGAMLFSRMVQRISASQEICAERKGLVPRRRRDGNSIGSAIVDLLKATVFGACLGLAVVTAAVPSIVSDTLRWLEAFGDGQIAPHTLLEAAALEVNKMAPQQIDQITRLERAHVEGDQFVYEYTLSVDKLTNDGIQNLFRHVRANAVPAFCAGEMKGLRQVGAMLVYRYGYTAGGTIGQVLVSEQDCH